MEINRLTSCYARFVPATASAHGKPYYGEGRVDVRTDNGCGDGYQAYAPSNIESPIQPPWRTIPWPCDARHTPVRPAATVLAHAAVKSIAGRADLVGVGRTLDVFV